MNVLACLPGNHQVFQQRIDGSVEFYRNWTEYKRGFGSVSGEFWLGNDNIHSLTSAGGNVLRIDMESFNGETRHVEYDGFSIEDESTNYVLRLSTYLASSNVGKLNQTYCAHRGPHIHASHARVNTQRHTRRIQLLAYISFRSSTTRTGSAETSNESFGCFSNAVTSEG